MSPWGSLLSHKVNRLKKKFNSLLVNSLMNKYIRFYIFAAIFSISGFCNAQNITGPTTAVNGQQIPVKENQLLYNGKVWRNLYLQVKGNQFLFSGEYLPGSVAMNGKVFNNLGLSYDIYNDELITTSNTGYNIQLNKEMVDSFSFSFQGRIYKFINTQDDSVPGVKGYVNVLYKGKSSLYLKYKKEIELLAVDDKYDLFFQSHRLYFIQDGKSQLISGKNDLLKILEKDKIAIKAYIKKNRLRVSKKDPDSFIPIVRYYDSLSQ
jgi:hypothetical protein